MPIQISNDQHQRVAELVGDSLLDRRQVGALLGMTENAIGAAMSRGLFPSELTPIRIGRRLRWRASTVRRWLDSAEAAGAAAR